MKIKLLIILSLFTLSLSAQERNSLKGIVIMGDARVPGVFVINKNSGQEVKTDGQGNFSIPARNGDRLVVHSAFTEDREFYISADSFKHMPYVLAVESKTTQLEEVVVSDSIKIIQPSKDVAVYSQGERKVNTGAKVTAHNMGYAGGGVAVSTDAVLNGAEKRRALRRELTTEQLQKNMASINAIYPNERIIEALGIPAEKVDAFLYYAAEDPELGKTLKMGNTEQNRTLLATLAAQYLEIQEDSETQFQTHEPLKGE